MAVYQQAVSGNAYKNKGGTVLKAGNITSTSPVTQNFTLLETVTAPLTYGAKVSLSSGTAHSSGNVGTASAFTNFAYKMVAGRYIMPKCLSYLNGVALSASSRLVVNGADFSGKPHRPIHYLETARTLGSGVTASFNPFTGTFTKGGNAGGSSSFGTDAEAHPTNALPGELAYKTGAKLPVADEYAPKTAP